MAIVLPFAVALAGMLMYALSANPKLVEIGRIMFWTGLLTFLLTFSPTALHALR